MKKSGTRFIPTSGENNGKSSVTGRSGYNNIISHATILVRLMNIVDLLSASKPVAEQGNIMLSWFKEFDVGLFPTE